MEPQPQEMACDLLLVGGTVVTLDSDRRVLDPGAVAVSGDRIVAVGAPEELVRCRAARTIRCEGRALIPGLVDCHTHAFQSLARTLGEGMSLHPWLRGFMWPWASAIRPEEARIGETLSAVEAARSGTTCIVDNYYGPSDVEATLGVADAVDQVGIRGVIARSITGPMTDIARELGMFEGFFRWSAEEELEITRTCMEARPAGGRVVVWPAPLNVLYIDHDLVSAAASLATEGGVRWHTHCSESPHDPGSFVQAHGRRPLRWLSEEGLLTNAATLAHAVWLDDEEVSLAGEHRVNVSHNPVSNQYLASGVARVGDLRAAGAVVGLGTDGPACGHRQDLFETMKAAVLLQRVHALDPLAAVAEDALEMATRDGARYVGLDAGSIEVGRLADLVVVDLTGPHVVPHHRAVAALVYAARASDVVMTIVGGRILFEDGRCTLIDEAALIEEARGRAGEIVARAGLERLLSPWRPGAS